MFIITDKLNWNILSEILNEIAADYLRFILERDSLLPLISFLLLSYRKCLLVCNSVLDQGARLNSGMARVASFQLVSSRVSLRWQALAS